MYVTLVKVQRLNHEIETQYNQGDVLSGYISTNVPRRLKMDETSNVIIVLSVETPRKFITAVINYYYFYLLLQ